MISAPGPVILDCRVAKEENCFPMIPSGKAHNEMILAEDFTGEEIDEEGKILV
jgi:acetolactate synthase-1/2/3 large subunit